MMRKRKLNKWLWICMCIVIGLWCVSFTVNIRIYAKSDTSDVTGTTTMSTSSDPADADKDSAAKGEDRDASSALGAQLRSGAAKGNSGELAMLQGTDTKSGSLGGSGTSGEPYQISTYADLKEFADIVNGSHAMIAQNSSACAKLMNDIDCKGELDWTSMGKDEGYAYTGTFDGDGHTITGLSTPKNYSGDYAGLFGYVGQGGTVKNVGLEGGSINAKSFQATIYVGGVAGKNDGTVQNCYNKGSVTTESKNAYLGGVVGWNTISGKVIDCYNTGDVYIATGYTTQTNSYVGGVIGQNKGGTVTNCYNTGTITGAVTGAGTQITSRIYVGGVIGYNTEGGKVTTCYNAGVVIGTETGVVDGSQVNVNVGGVVGYNTNNAEVTSCYNTGAATGTGENSKTNVYVGGVGGYNGADRYGGYGTITNCYNIGVVSATGTGTNVYAGGVAGCNLADDVNIAKVTNCYNTGAVSATGTNVYVGGVAGCNQGGTVTNCYYDKSVCGEIGAINSSDDVTNHVQGFTTDVMTGIDALNYMTGFADTVWLVKKADDFYSYYPHLKGFNFDSSGVQMTADAIPQKEWPSRNLKNVVFMISSYDELLDFAAQINNPTIVSKDIAILMNNIDCSASGLSTDDPNYIAWTPIGNASNSYKGIFDGDGHTITGLTFNGDSSVGGLFGYVGQGGTVKNVGLKDGSIQGKNYVGAVVGHNSGTVTNCYNTGAVTGNNYVGGVVGQNEGGTVTNCYNTGDVSAAGTGTNVSVGGVIGCNVEKSGRVAVEAKVTNCYSTGAVSATGTGTNVSVGGVVGSNSGTVKNCYYDKSMCSDVGGAINGSDDTTNNVKGFTTDLMTGTNALSNMTGFIDTVWILKDDGGDKDKYYWYYPHLKGFAYDTVSSAANWPPRVEVSVTGDNKVYDGQPASVGVTVGDDFVPEGINTQHEMNDSGQWIELKDNPIESGKYRVIYIVEDKQVVKYFTILKLDRDYNVKYQVKTGVDDDGDPIWSEVTGGCINAGDYSATIEFKTSGHADINHEFTIKKSEVTVSVQDAGDVEYDGKEHESDKAVVFAGVVDGEIASITYTSAKGTLVGTYTGSYGDDFAVKRADGTTDSTDNYMLTTKQPGSLTITNRTTKYEITVVANSSTENTYDGTQKSTEGFKTLDFTVNENKYTVEGLKTSDPKSTDVTTTEGIPNEISGTAVVKDANGNDVTRQFKVNTENGKLIIKPAKLTIIAEAKSKTYGEVDPELTYTSSGLVEGDNITGALTRETGENVGTYAIMKGTLTAGGNYIIDYTGANLAIGAKRLAITADSAKKEYDGQALTKDSYTNTALVKGDSVESVTITGSQTVAGSSDNVPSEAKIVNSKGEDVTSNYDITYVNGTLTISKAKVTVTAEAKSKTYGSKDPELTAKVEGLVGEDKLNYTLSRTAGENVGEYDIMVTLGENPNYDVTVTGEKFTIDPAVPQYESPKYPIDGTQGQSEQDQDLGEPKGVDGQELSGTWTWVEGEKLRAGKEKYQVTFTPDDTNYASITSDVVVSTWGTEVNNGSAGKAVINYVAKDGTTSAEVSGKGIIWLKEESERLSTWYGIDNSNGTFENGSRFWVRWLSKTDDPEEWEKYYDKLDVAHRELVKDNKLWIFLMGVTKPDGTEYTGTFGSEVDLYIQLGTDWNENDIKAVFISDTEDEDLSVRFIEKYSLLDGTYARVAVVSLRHFSPYAVYDEVDDHGESSNDDSVDTNNNSSGTGSGTESEVCKTSDTIPVQDLFGLELLMMLALVGLCCSLKRKRI